MAHRTFSSRIDPDRAPTTFTLDGDRVDGKGRPTGEMWSEDFTALPKVPSVALDDLAQSVRIDSKGRQAYNAPSVLNFLRRVIVPDDLERFEALVSDPARNVELDLMADVMNWLVDELGGRPTKR